MNRIDRVTAILIQLQSKRVVKAQDIADRFKISLRTVYRDVRALEAAGVPVIGEAGVGYSLMEGYRLPPVMFTRDEATAFLTAEKFTDSFTDEQFKSAMYKVRAVLRSSEKESLEELDDRIEVVHTPHSDERSNVLQRILKSITEKEVLHIEYTTQAGRDTTKRDVEPVGVLYIGNKWHLIAWCRLRNDYRDFRTDRISMLQHTGKRFAQEHPSLKEYLDKIALKEELQTVVVLFKKDILKYMNEQKYLHGFVCEVDRGDKVEMTFLVRATETIARWMLMLTNNVEIVSPDGVKARVRELAGNIAKHYL